MRKKMNYQRTEYSQNGELLCFGLSEHDLTEMMPKWSETAQKDINLLRSWFSNKGEDLLARPAYKSDFNMNIDLWRAQLRFALGGLLIRELPIKNFFARVFIIYIYGCYFLGRGLSKGLRPEKPAVYYMTDYSIKPLLNRPDLFKWSLCRVLPKVPVVNNVTKDWRARQQPVFHQYHRTTYRYRMRKPRYVPWDGTMSQPVMPFLIDDGTDVINGTFRRNPNTDPEFK